VCGVHSILFTKNTLNRCKKIFLYLHCGAVDVRLPPDRLKLIKLPCLLNRRIMLGIVFMYKLIDSHICSMELMSQLIFSVPRRVVSRNFIPIVLRTSFKILCSDYNRLFDITATANSIPHLKTLLLSQQLV